MMSLGSFNSSLKDAQLLLRNVNLLKNQGIKVINRNDVSQEFKTASQGKDYFKLYKCAIKNFDYDLVLNDDSIFQFSYKFSSGRVPEVRYAFFQNPQEYKSYEEFLDLLRSINLIQDETNNEIGTYFEEDYQQFLTEQNLNSSATTIRYDVDEDLYQPHMHSVSHFHIGHQNSIRIPCKLILNPLHFTIFVIKQIYYQEWKTLIQSGNLHLKTAISNSKSGCFSLNNTHWTTNEALELFIT